MLTVPPSHSSHPPSLLRSAHPLSPTASPNPSLRCRHALTPRLQVAVRGWTPPPSLYRTRPLRLSVFLVHAMSGRPPIAFNSPSRLLGCDAPARTLSFSITLRMIFSYSVHNVQPVPTNATSPRLHVLIAPNDPLGRSQSLLQHSGSLCLLSAPWLARSKSRSRCACAYLVSATPVTLTRTARPYHSCAKQHRRRPHPRQSKPVAPVQQSNSRKGRYARPSQSRSVSCSQLIYPVLAICCPIRSFAATGLPHLVSYICLPSPLPSGSFLSITHHLTVSVP